jgi:hypothetical protein
VTADLDELIRDNFLLSTRNRIHYKVLEYFYKATQIVIELAQDHLIISDKEFRFDFDKASEPS